MLDDDERRHAAGLMRINHVGEVCAQALYVGQAAVARDPEPRARTCSPPPQEETDHLAWCADRLRELDSRPSLLNPLWYAGSYAIGVLAGLRGDGWNLGFVVETERQVEAHLHEHLERLPAGRPAQPRDPGNDEGRRSAPRRPRRGARRAGAAAAGADADGGGVEADEGDRVPHLMRIAAYRSKKRPALRRPSLCVARLGQSTRLRPW